MVVRKEEYWAAWMAVASALQWVALTVAWSAVERVGLSVLRKAEKKAAQMAE